MQITVFGATGRTGVPVVRQALDRGHDVVAVVRPGSSLAVEGDGLRIVEAEVYEGTGVEDAVAGADAVVSVLGQTDDGPDDLLTVAGDNVVAAMAAAGVDRYVTLVGAGVREDGERVGISGQVMGTLLRLLDRAVLEDAEEHVRRVRATDLDWTVVRPPRLTEADGTGDYRAGDIDLGFESLARADLARFLLDCVEQGSYVRAMPKVASA